MCKHGPNVIYDKTQGVDRCGARSDGILPTVTPRGSIVIGSLGRVLTDEEKLYIHGIQAYKLPEGVSQKILGEAVGNSMHICAVGLAQLSALACVNWSLPQAQAGHKMISTLPNSFRKRAR